MVELVGSETAGAPRIQTDSFTEAGWASVESFIFVELVTML